MKLVELLECNIGVNSYSMWIVFHPQSHLAPISAEGSEETEFDYGLHSAFSNAAGSCF